MGCTTTKSTTPLAKENISALYNGQEQKRAVIEKFNFDLDEFKFVKEIQDTYTELYGAFLLPDRVAGLVAELKKFFYLCAKERLNGSTKKLIPSPIVDRLWRILISNSRGYIKFCDLVFDGSFPRATLTSLNIKDYHYTISLYEEDFQQNLVDWPPYGSVQSYLSSMNGFIYMRSSEFIDFHNYFSPQYKGFQDFQNLQKVYKTEIEGLRKRTFKKYHDYMTEKAKPRFQIPRQLTESAVQRKQEDEYDREEEQYYNIVSARLRDKDKHSIGKKLKAFTVRIKLTDKENGNLNKDQQVKAQLIELFKSNNNDDTLSFISRRSSILKDDTILSARRNKEEHLGDNQYRSVPKYDFTDLKVKWNDQYSVRQELEAYPIPQVVIKNFSSDFNLDPRLTQLIFRQYKRFLSLKSLGITIYQFYYPFYIKKAWEYHSAETQEYSKFCERIFNNFVPVVHFPRQITEAIIDKYERTLYAYREFYEEEPLSVIWPSVEERFNEDEQYSHKMFNIRGYMSQVINRIQSQVLLHKKALRETFEGRAAEKQELRARKKAMAHMEVNQHPDKGSEHIHIGSATLEAYENVETEETEI